jgi:hypothetical protein
MVFNLKRAKPGSGGSEKPSDSLNYDSEILPGDTDHVIPEQSEEDNAIVRLVNERFQSAADDRRPLEGAWFESMAFYLGNQWVTWNSGAGNLRSTRDPRRPWKVYDARNKIRPKIGKLKARALKAKPTVTVSPLTSSALDKAAASEARAILSDLDIRFKRQQQVKRLTQAALTTSTSFLKITWNPNAEAEIEKIENGKVVGSRLAKVGNISEDIVPCFEIFADPKARDDWEEASWIIHEKVRSISELRDKYGEGINVEGDVNEGPSGYVESRLASVVGEYKRGNEPGQSSKSVSVKEMWEKPSKRYPEGRLITVAGNRLLRNDPWPYIIKRYPFIPMSFEEGQSTLWGLNAVSDLISPQKSYNEKVSRGAEWMRTSWGKVFVSKGSAIGATAFDSAAPNEVIYYEGAIPPIHVPGPQFQPAILQLLDIDIKDMDDSSGVHEISSGSAPAGVTAGVSLQLMLEQDTTQMSDFIQNIETWHQLRSEYEIALASQYYKEDRLMSVSRSNDVTSPRRSVKAPSSALLPAQSISDNSNTSSDQGGLNPGSNDPSAPQAQGNNIGAPPPPSISSKPQAAPGADDPDDDWLSAPAQAKSFKALAQGGSCRVMITPASALAMSPAAKLQQITEMYQAGTFGPIGSPVAIRAFLKLMEFANADEIVEEVERYQAQERAHAIAMTPNPMQLAQMQNQGRQEAQAAAQAHQAEMQALEDHKVQIQTQANQASAAQAAQLKMQHDAQILAINHNWEAQAKMMDAKIELMVEHVKRLLPPAFAPISVSADPAAAAQVEQIALRDLQDSQGGMGELDEPLGGDDYSQSGYGDDDYGSEPQGDQNLQQGPGGIGPENTPSVAPDQNYEDDNESTGDQEPLEQGN